jgi:hypothetical protein
MNGHYIKTMCRVQKLGRYLKGQGHSGHLQFVHIPYMYIVKVLLRVRIITLLFVIRFQNQLV